MSRRDILSVVRRIQQSALTGSNMAAGFQRLYNDVFVVSRGSRPTATKYVILLTDGTTSRDPESTQYHVINNTLHFANHSRQLRWVRLNYERPVHIGAIEPN